MSQSGAANGDLPFWSIVVPTYRRPARLATCLAALANLDYPRDRFEVIVVDDGSGAPPADLIAQYDDHVTIALLTPPHLGPAAARNAGLARARGEYVAFTDDDCAPQPAWLLGLAEAAARAPEQALGGHTVNALCSNPWSAASQLLVDYLYVYYNAVPGQARFFTSNNLAFPVEALRALGGFNAAFPLAAGEDRDLCDRWLATGRRLTHVPAAVVSHAHQLTACNFWRQHLAYGRGAWHFRQARASRGAGRVHLEPLRFYVNLIRFPFGQTSGQQASVLAALLVVAQVANLLGFAWESLAHRPGMARSIPRASTRRPGP